MYGGYLNGVDVVVDSNQGDFHFVIGRDGRANPIGPAWCKARPDAALALMWPYSHIDRMEHKQSKAIGITAFIGLACLLLVALSVLGHSEYARLFEAGLSVSGWLTG